MDIKSLLSSSILSKAYEYNSEYAWKPEDISELSLILKEKKIAVLGGEIWEKTAEGPMIGSDIYQWTARQKSNNEFWESYVDSTLREMSNFIENLPKEKSLDQNTYINIEMIDQNNK